MILLNDFKLRLIAKPSAKVNRSPYVASSDFDLPVNFCIHHVTDTPTMLGMRGSNALIKTWLHNGGVGLYHVNVLNNPRHRARKTNVSNAALNKYFQGQSSFDKIIKIERALPRERQLLVMDYSPLSISMVIPQGLYEFYHKFDNLAGNILDNVKNVTAQRNNIIQIRFPEILPDRSIFNKIDTEVLASDEATQWLDYDQFWLRDMWLLIHDKGLIKKFLVKVSNGKDSTFHTNLYMSFVIADHVVTIDINKLYMDGRESETETKNAFYKLLQDAQEKITGSDTDGLEGVEEATESDIENTEDALLELTKDSIRNGRMSVSEQSRLIKIASQSVSIPSNKGIPVGELAITKPEDYNIEIDEPSDINELITTKNEASSTISSFHKSYLKNVMDKHLAAVALSFNNSGYILRDYAIDEEVDVANHRRIIKIKIMPIIGKETTFEIPVPVVQEDGTWLADGVQYSTDIQRVDIKSIS